MTAMQKARRNFSNLAHEEGDAILRQAVLTLADYLNFVGYHGTASVARRLVEEYDRLARHFDYREPD